MPRRSGLICGLCLATVALLGCAAEDKRPERSLTDAGAPPADASGPRADAMEPIVVAADAAPRDAAAVAADASAGFADAAAPLVPDAGALVDVETDQRFRDLRPEFLDYFWNNLNSARWKQWHPGAHEAFVWTSAPAQPGDLGAELGAAYQAQVMLGGAAHDLRVRYVDSGLPQYEVTFEGAMAAEVWLDGAGPLRLVVQYQQEQDDVHVKQRWQLPAGADQAAWRAYLEERMTTLAAFIREPFQREYVEQEITKRGSFQVTTTGLDFDIVVMQDIRKLTPQMVDWWWDNMGETERYRHWHPTAHQSFTWTTPPKNASDLRYDVGSAQKIVEVIGESTTLNITWLDPAQVPLMRTYTNFLYGQTNLDGTPFGGFLVHEYEALPQGGGIRMKSTFRLPWLAGDPFAKALGEHCIQEMQFLQYYLPRLFAKEFKP
jgi:hypothetical protein